MKMFQIINTKFIFLSLLALLLAGCQSAKTIDPAEGNTSTTVIPSTDTGTTNPIDNAGSMSGTESDPSGNGVVRDAYGNIIGEMVNGVFVPCENCPTGATSTGISDPLSVMTIYFDYDQTSIKPEFREVLQAHAQNLASRAGMNLRLEGHADERGSREYNIGLGERRAQAVKRVLMLSGANSNALNTVSYGEEQPAVSGSSASSYSQNRRVVLVYR